MIGNLIWSIVLGAIGIFGIYLAGSKNIYGWVLGFFAQILWFIFALVTAQYGFILSAVAYGIVYARNYLRWNSDKKQTQTKNHISVGTGQQSVGTAIPTRLTSVSDIPQPQKPERTGR